MDIKWHLVRIEEWKKEGKTQRKEMNPIHTCEFVRWPKKDVARTAVSNPQFKDTIYRYNPNVSLNLWQVQVSIVVPRSSRSC
jgi:hypothetical protein